MSAVRPFMDPGRRRPWTSLPILLCLVFCVGVLALAGELPLLLRVEAPWALPLGVALGHLSFALSVGLPRFSPKAAWISLLASLRLVYRPYGLRTAVFYLQIAAAEELLFRALPLRLLGDGPAVLLGFAALFALIHVGRRGRRGLPLLQLLEFFLFGLLLGLLFRATGDLWPLILTHWLRNVCVAKVMVRKDRLQAQRAATYPQEGAGLGAGDEKESQEARSSAPDEL